MKPDWLIADVTPAGSPDRAERAILGMMLGVFGQFRAFLADSGHFCGRGSPFLM